MIFVESFESEHMRHLIMLVIKDNIIHDCIVHFIFKWSYPCQACHQQSRVSVQRHGVHLLRTVQEERVRPEECVQSPWILHDSGVLADLRGEACEVWLQ